MKATVVLFGADTKYTIAFCSALFSAEIVTGVRTMWFNYAKLPAKIHYIFSKLLPFVCLLETTFGKVALQKLFFLAWDFSWALTFKL